MNDTIGSRLRCARLESGYSSEAAADKIGVARETITTWEQDENIPSGYNLIRICRLYCRSADWILFGDEAISHE